MEICCYLHNWLLLKKNLMADIARKWKLFVSGSKQGVLTSLKANINLRVKPIQPKSWKKMEANITELLRSPTSCLLDKHHRRMGVLRLCRELTYTHGERTHLRSNSRDLHPLTPPITSNNAHKLRKQNLRNDTRWCKDERKKCLENVKVSRYNAAMLLIEGNEEAAGVLMKNFFQGQSNQR